MSAFPAGIFILNIIFVISLMAMGAGAVIAVWSPRLIRAVVGLAICCIGLAGLFYFLHSPFLALMEILIYVGAVCVTMIFAIMLAEPDEPAADTAGSRGFAWTVVGWLVPAAIFAAVCCLSIGQKWAVPATVGSGSVGAIGSALLMQYGLAFELISLALLVATLGALAIARTGRHKG